MISPDAQAKANAQQAKWREEQEEASFAATYGICPSCSGPIKCRLFSTSTKCLSCGKVYFYKDRPKL